MVDRDIIVSKKMIAILTFLILCLTAISSVVAYSVGVQHTAKEALDNSYQCLNELEYSQTQIIDNREDIAVITSQYADIIRRLASIENKIDTK